MTITADRQVEFRGLRLDGAYEIQSIEGLADAPEVRTSDLARSARDGFFAGDDLHGGRTIVITVQIYSWAEADFAAAVQAFRAAFQTGGAVEYPLSFQLPGIGDGGVARINCRCRRRALPLTPVYWAQAVTAVVELFATDPRIFSDVEQTTSVVLQLAEGGGHVWNQVWPNDWGPYTPPSYAFATNAGAVEADVAYRIDGPVINPVIENLTTGATFSVGLTLDTGEYLLLDTAARTVLLNGTANRYHAVDAGSTWPTLAVGANVVRFSADTDTDALLTMTWRDTWI